MFGGGEEMKNKIIIVWFAIVLMGCFCLTAMTGPELVDISVVPEVPRADEPIITTFKLNNPASEAALVNFSFYANGELLQEGTSMLASHSSKTYQYVYRNPLELGKQVNFVVKAESRGQTCEKIVSLPAYPPQIMSSFVSFASFSTSVMGFMASSTYYDSSFGSPDEGLNVGLVISIVLIILLIFLELSEPILTGGHTHTHVVLGKLRMQYSTMTAILFFIFIGIVYTKIVMILVV
ncbi:hypothetical protein DRN76_00965 [Methanosarcinales archaeon]|nr:MAG: hypothetical protein DRN76_00965 [Methanosarcinales archaeon]